MKCKAILVFLYSLSKKLIWKKNFVSISLIFYIHKYETPMNDGHNVKKDNKQIFNKVKLT